MEAERSSASDSEALTRSVADVYARLLAYKDEYEVARLLTGVSVRGELAETFEGGYRIRYNLAPPLISRRDPATGRLRKRSFGSWLTGPLRLLALLKRLRGTPFDLFGYHPHRAMERALIGEYEAIVDEILERLRPDNHAPAVELARAYGHVRGFDVVKEANIEKARTAAAQARAVLLASDVAPIAEAPAAAARS